MSNLPRFIGNQQGNAFWESSLKQKQNWLDRRIRAVLKKESLAVRYTYGYLRYVDKDQRGFAYPAQATIAKAVKVSPRHVIRCLARLEELQLIQRGKKSGHSYYIFTVPHSCIDTKSPLEERIEEITQEVKELKEKALRHYLKDDKVQTPVSCKCHTNKKKIINKIKETPKNSTPKDSPPPYNEPSPKGNIPKKPEEDWFSWIEEKKSITLCEKEKDDLQKIKSHLLYKRQNRFKNFPRSFLDTYLYELALTFSLAKHRQLYYTGPPCELLKEINL